MNDKNFDKFYLHLLREQVQVEIKFLVKVGHDTKHPAIACIWCQDYKGRNICNRLTELKQFLSQIVVKQNQKPLQEIPHCEFTTLAVTQDDSLPLLSFENILTDTV